MRFLGKVGGYADNIIATLINMYNYESLIAFIKFYNVADCNRIGGTESLEAEFAPDPAFCEFPSVFF